MYVIELTSNELRIMKYKSSIWRPTDLRTTNYNFTS